jgi:hypothetical protein
LGKLEDLVGTSIFLFAVAASFESGEGLAVDGGSLASGVNNT